MYDGIIDKPNLDETYLSHHGIKGQKWGIKNGPPYPLDSSKSTGKSLKKGASAKKKKIKSAVKAYEKQWDKAESLEDKADEVRTKGNEIQREADAAWKETRRLRKQIGKTPISRVYRTIRYPEDKNVKAYEKQWDKAESLEDKADEVRTKGNEIQREADAAWKETRRLRKQIGKTPISRVYRTIKYGK